MMKHVLTIAGSDSSGGAGIQGDLKTIAAHGCHGLSVITAVTAQNSQAITSIVRVSNVLDQCEALGKDITIHGVKIGMLYSLENVKAVLSFVTTYIEPKKIPIVLDPLIYSTTGKRLLEEDAVELIEQELIPKVSLLTPNLFEAAYFLKKEIKNKNDLFDGLKELYDKFNVPILIKGGHSLAEANKDDCSDTLYDGNDIRSFHHNRVKAKHTHGTGCCLSTAITCQLALGKSLVEALIGGKTFVTMAIEHGYELGRGEGPVDPLIHFITNYVTMNDVANSCLAIGGRPIMAEEMDEMKDIVPKGKGLVISLGTISKERLHLIETSLRWIDTENQPVLLDPVGCGSSSFRLDAAISLLKTGKISILKVNPREGEALWMGEFKETSFGVDSDAMKLNEKEVLAKNLFLKYGEYSKSLIVVITGEVDVVASKDRLEIIRGGSSLQQTITGTGCMLNALLITSAVKKGCQISSIVHGLDVMNRASETAAKKLKNKKHSMSYKTLLINEIAQYKKLIYLITDETMDFESELLPKTEEAFKKGVSMLQYRVKKKSEEKKYFEAQKLRELTHQYGVTFIINDDMELARKVKADGVHLGELDGTITKAREYLGEEAIIGATAKTIESAKAAQLAGANYLGVGALNPSPTKPEAKRVSVELLAEIRKSVHLPIYGIGGINLENLTEEIMNLVEGVAVVSGIYKASDEKIQELVDYVGVR